MSLKISENAPLEPDDMIGKKVIARTNEDEPLTVGEFVGYGFHNIPKIHDEATNETVMHMGIIIPYSDVMLEILNNMTPQQQWAFLTEITMTIKVLRKAEYPTG